MSEAIPPQLSNEKMTSKLGVKHPKWANVISPFHVEISQKNVLGLGNLSEESCKNIPNIPHVHGAGAGSTPDAGE